MLTVIPLRQRPEFCEFFAQQFESEWSNWDSRAVQRTSTAVNSKGSVAQREGGNRNLVKHLEYGVQRPQSLTVDQLFGSVLKAVGVVGGFALFVYVLFRAVLGARKAGGTGSAEILATLLLALGIGIAPAPPREVKIELKRDEDESGDPPDAASTELTEPTGREGGMPNDQRPRTARAYKPEMEEFAVDFVGDLVPLVESRYRVVADRVHRAIAGNSMGGGQALAIGLTHPEMFSSVASFSAAMQIADNPAWGGVDMDTALANAGAINGLDMLWVGCGTEDNLFNVNKLFSEQLTKAGIEHTFRSTPGAHTPAVLSRYLHEVAPTA